MNLGVRVMQPLFLSDFKESFIFSTDFLKHTQISIFMKILQPGVDLFRLDGRTGRHKKRAHGRFSQFGESVYFYQLHG
jgi:hypothetical protein